MEPLTADKCWKELQDALDVPVQVHFTSNHLPAEAKLTLQEAMEQWSSSDVDAALERSIDALRLLHLRATPEIRPMVDQYLKVLSAYFNNTRDPRLGWEVGNNHPSLFIRLKSDAVSQLDALDKQRSAQPVSVHATAANTP